VSKKLGELSNDHLNINGGVFRLCGGTSPRMEESSIEMATGTRNPSTRRVLPDKEAGME
jgi:hypothetical protein